MSNSAQGADRNASCHDEFKVPAVSLYVVTEYNISSIYFYMKVPTDLFLAGNVRGGFHIYHNFINLTRSSILLQKIAIDN